MRRIIPFIIIVLIIISAITTATSAVYHDVNRDGKFNISDITAIQKYRVGLNNKIDFDAADINSDGAVTIRDATYGQMILAGIILEEETTVAETEMKMFINDTPVTVEWEDNESVASLKESVKNNPLMIQMSMYGGFEQVGALGITLPRNDTRITTQPGDVILYSGNQMVVFYGSNTWGYTRLGRISDKTQDELTKLLSNGSVTITITY
ncbi:MAG: hypothetical protein IJT79_10140 [Ruminococcus sp.]|nr:hypothetical protein [Ruminococcus sp.]